MYTTGCHVSSSPCLGVHVGAQVLHDLLGGDVWGVRGGGWGWGVGVGGALPACGCAWVLMYSTICSAEMPLPSAACTLPRVSIPTYRFGSR